MNQHRRPAVWERLPNLFKQHVEVPGTTRIGVLQTALYFIFVAVAVVSVTTVYTLGSNKQVVQIANPTLAQYRQLLAEGQLPSCTCNNPFVKVSKFLQLSYTQDFFCYLYRRVASLCQQYPNVCQLNYGDDPSSSTLSQATAGKQICDSALSVTDNIAQNMLNSSLPSPTLLPPVQLQGIVDGMASQAHQNILLTFTQPFNAISAWALVDRPLSGVGHADMFLNLGAAFNGSVPVVHWAWQVISDYNAAKTGCNCMRDYTCSAPGTTLLGRKYNLTLYCSGLFTNQQFTPAMYADPLPYQESGIPLSVRDYVFKGAPTPVFATAGEASLNAYLASFNYSSDYASYYSLCAPSECHYIITVQTPVLTAFSVVLGVLGGITVSARILILASTQLIVFFCGLRPRLPITRRSVADVDLPLQSQKLHASPSPSSQFSSINTVTELQPTDLAG